MFSSELSYHSARLKDVAFRAGQHVLHLDASHGPTSVVSHGAQAFFAEMQKFRPDLEVRHLRLWEDDMRPKLEYNLSHVRSKFAMLEGTATAEDIERFADIEDLAASVASAESLVVSVPMWNYGVPWVLKQYFDCVLHPGLSFQETSSGPKGLLGGGKALVIIASSGGNPSKDHLRPWLADVAAMMGFDTVHSIAAAGISHSSREEAMQSLSKEAERVARAISVPSEAGVPGSTDATAPSNDNDDEEKTVGEWSDRELLKWLKAQGGLSDDAIESIEAMKIDGSLWLSASEEDWQSDELGLDDADIALLVSLQRQHVETSGAG